MKSKFQARTYEQPDTLQQEVHFPALFPTYITHRVHIGLLIV
uniref:Uncharacterized protein n=1 Tax=Rhizophora mucronata TaxID=61149 RepID=A0A2P2P301_RHIMU